MIIYQNTEHGLARIFMISIRLKHIVHTFKFNQIFFNLSIISKFQKEKKIERNTNKYL